MSHNKIWLYSNRKIISCPVASVLYGEGKEEGRRKKEEGRRKGKTLNMVNIPPTFTQTIPADMILLLLNTKV